MKVISLNLVEYQVEEWEVSHDGKLIAGKDSKNVNIWNLSNGSLFDSVPVRSLIPRVISDLGTWNFSFSPDSKFLVFSFSILQTSECNEYDYLVYSSHWIYDLANTKVKYQFDSEPYERCLGTERDHQIVGHLNGVMICEKGKFFVSWGQIDSGLHYDCWSLGTGEEISSEHFQCAEYIAIASDHTFIWVDASIHYDAFRIDPSVQADIAGHCIVEYELFGSSFIVGEQDDEDLQIRFLCESVDNLAHVRFTNVRTNKTYEIKTKLSEVKTLLIAQSEIAVVGDGRIELWSLESGELQSTYYITNKSQYKVQKSDDGITITHPTQPSMTVMFDTDDLS